MSIDPERQRLRDLRAAIQHTYSGTTKEVLPADLLAFILSDVLTPDQLQTVADFAGVQTTYRPLEMNSAQEETFRNLWDAAQGGHEVRYDLRTLAQQIRPNLTDADFDRGWQHTNPTADDFAHARNEFLLLVRRTI